MDVQKQLAFEGFKKDWFSKRMDTTLLRTEGSIAEGTKKGVRKGNKEPARSYIWLELLIFFLDSLCTMNSCMTSKNVKSTLFLIAVC